MIVIYVSKYFKFIYKCNKGSNNSFTNLTRMTTIPKYDDLILDGLKFNVFNKNNIKFIQHKILNHTEIQSCS